MSFVGRRWSDSQAGRAYGIRNDLQKGGGGGVMKKETGWLAIRRICVDMKLTQRSDHSDPSLGRTRSPRKGRVSVED
jgi:hypothetical protein